MSQNLHAGVEPISIEASGTVSRWVSREEIGDADVITLYGPATLDAFTFTIETTSDNVLDPTITPVVTTHQDDTPADIAPPLANKSRTYFDLPSVGAFRIKSSSAVVAKRTWRCTKQFKG